jgi:hypothetical protein
MCLLSLAERIFQGGIAVFLDCLFTLDEILAISSNLMA